MNSPPTSAEGISPPQTSPGNSRLAHELSASSLYTSLGKFQRTPLRRPARPLTYELRNHVAVYLEDGQYSEAFAFLSSLLASGTSISNLDRLYPAFIASPPQLALASSLIAYPPITTKAKSPDRQKGSDAALRYLQSLRTIISPLTDNYMTSFVFPIESPRRLHKSLGLDSDDDQAHERLNCLAATKQSLWQRAEDFWHIVGWAFNCSVMCQKRWERWRLWLDIMLELLEAEWSERKQLYAESDGPKDDSIITASLIWKYIASQDPQSRACRRRIFRAILSTGGSQSLKEFPEIWYGETAENKPEEESNDGPKTIDISNDDFGEYGRDEENEMDEMPSISNRTTSGRAAARKLLGSVGEESLWEDDNHPIHDAEHAIEKLGGMDAIHLRQRLLLLLVHVAATVPQYFTSLEDVYDLYTESTRSLPTILFGTLLSTSILPSVYQVALGANLLLPLLSARLPSYSIICPTQADMENILLPSAASTHSYAANAKISLILESMFRNMAQIDQLQATDTLRKAVELGIKARDIPYGNAKRKKGNEHEEEQSKELMELSNERLLGMLEVLEIVAGKPIRMRSTPTDELPMTSSLSSAISILSSQPGGDTDEE